MTRRQTLIVLAVSLLAFAGMIVLVSVGVVSRRRDRDFTFGLEHLDILLEDANLDEAVAMLPWLAERADEAGEMLSVLKRGLELLDAGAGPAALDKAATIAVQSFPGNEAIRSVAVYAAAVTGDYDRALKWGREIADTNPDLFAWVLMSAGLPAQSQDLPRQTEPDGTTADGYFLASLGTDAGAEDLERAWRVTGDWRYAADSAALRMAGGEIARAVEVASGASLSLHAPMLAADVFADAGDPESALGALRNAPQGLPEVILRRADALMAMGRFNEASEIYRALLEENTAASAVPYLNLAWLTLPRADATALYDQAVEAFPESWPAIEQRALALAGTDLPGAFRSLSDYRGPANGVREKLLRLRMAPRMDQRAYEGEIWRLVNAPDADEEVLRYAAWYFAGTREFTAVAELLDGLEGDKSWIWTYRGILHAAGKQRDQAAEAFNRAFLAEPSWRTALNLSLAHFSRGDAPAGFSALETAADLARRAGYPPGSVAVFVASARVQSDASRARAAVDQALRIDPAHTGALLLRSQLESGDTY